MEIKGEHTTADVKLPENEIEESLEGEIQEMVDHEAFQNPVKFMPDCHGGLGPQAIVGFSMELTDRVVPNTIGGDIGCGMTAVKIEGVDVDFDEIDDLREINESVREAVPMGTGRVNDHDEDFERLYPWGVANCTLVGLMDFQEHTRTSKSSFEDERFDMEYFEGLCESVGISEEYAKNSLGSLGGGNHFIEVSRSDNDGDLWIIVHSGSRNLGQKVKAYHQDRATELRDGDVEWDEMTAMQRTYANDDGSPNWEMIRKTFSGESIQKVAEGIEALNPDDNRNKDLDHLEGEEMFQYLKDMAFAQEYASENRRLMAQEVAKTLNASITETINSPHNYVDFWDGVIRKGSTRALDGKRFVIPMNMEDGTLLCRGKGNPEWNNSAPHGAGRLGSRGWAHSQFDNDEVRQRMYDNGTYSTNVPTDEVPEAYKDTELIEEQIKPTAEIVDRLVPVMNFKA